MKLDIKKVKQIPKEVDNEFGICVFGDPKDDVVEWIKFHELNCKKVGPYTNIYINKNINDLFESTPLKYTYLDGFSPNLNKHLHLGHFSNLVLAKAFVGIKVANKTVAILGDTLTGEVSKEEALEKFNWYCKTFSYNVDKLFFASTMQCDELVLENGEEEYEGTKIFNLNGKKIVGKKNTGATTYFYQDVSLATELNAPTLYLTGHEQTPHFKDLKFLFNNIDHVGLGLVKAGKKMSSRLGNVIYADDLLTMILDKFNGDMKVAYNIIAGHILKSTPQSDKNIDLEMLDNPLNSKGLYLSYTLAKMKSAGVPIIANENFVSLKLQFKLLKAQELLSPNVLFEELIDHAKHISVLYESHLIKDNEENKNMFSILASDLALGLKMLGMYEVDKV